MAANLWFRTLRRPIQSRNSKKKWLKSVCPPTYPPKFGGLIYFLLLPPRTPSGVAACQLEQSLADQWSRMAANSSWRRASAWPLRSCGVWPWPGLQKFCNGAAECHRQWRTCGSPVTTYQFSEDLQRGFSKADTIKKFKEKVAESGKTEFDFLWRFVARFWKSRIT